MNFLRSLYEKIRDGFLWSFKESEPYFKIFGVAVLIGVVGFYFVNLALDNKLNTDIYECIYLRTIAAFSTIPIIFHQFWPQRYRKHLIWYWYLVLTYTLPFFFSFMMLMNPQSNVWHLNGIICLFILSLFVDIVSLLLILSAGISAGITYFLIKKGATQAIFPRDLQQILYNYIGPLIYLILFSRKREKILQHKINSMKITAEFIAHELRTPLAAMTMTAQALAKLLPYYCQAYEQAKAFKVPIKLLNHQQERNIVELPQTLENVSKNANLMLSMLLINLNDAKAKKNFDQCSMSQCVQEALDTYPFSFNERELVQFQKPAPEQDFFFYGNFELTKHILFNLLKNALHSISKKGAGKIFITLNPYVENQANLVNKPIHSLQFKDTGMGIAHEKVGLIFDRFFSDKELGAGIGLTFCKSTIENFGGEISCMSQFGEHATFTINLPVIESEKKMAA